MKVRVPPVTEIEASTLFSLMLVDEELLDEPLPLPEFVEVLVEPDPLVLVCDVFEPE